MKLSEEFFRKQLSYTPLVFLAQAEHLSAGDIKNIQQAILSMEPACTFLESTLVGWDSTFWDASKYSLIPNVASLYTGNKKTTIPQFFNKP